MRPSERRFLHSTVAAYGSQLARVAIRAAGDLLLARLLLPHDHGLFDLALGIAGCQGPRAHGLRSGGAYGGDQIVV